MNILRSPIRRGDGKVAWLSSMPWWRDLDRRSIEKLASTGDRVQVAAGRDIMRDGEWGREAAIVVSGSVEVLRDGELLATLGPGEVVGELSLLTGAHRNADVRTSADTELLVFSVTSLREVMAAAAPVREQILAAAEAHRE